MGDFGLFKHVVRYINDQKERELLELCQLAKSSPLPKEVRARLILLDSESLRRALVNHPGCKLNRKLQSVSAMAALLDQSVYDLKILCAEFASASAHVDKEERLRAEALIKRRVNKELLTACMASSALMAFLNRIKRQTQNFEFNVHKSQSIDPGLQDFMVDLRNALGHSVHLEARWNMSRKLQGWESTFFLDRDLLLREGEFKLEMGINFLKAQPKKIDISVLFENYRKSALSFKDAVVTNIETHLPEEVAEYRICIHKQKREAHRMILRAFRSKKPTLPL